MRIESKGEEIKYFDKHNQEIHEGDIVLMNGRNERVYLTKDGCLGTDATNPKWLENGRAVPCEYGIYPFNYRDDVEIVESIDDE